VKRMFLIFQTDSLLYKAKIMSRNMVRAIATFEFEIPSSVVYSVNGLGCKSI